MQLRFGDYKDWVSLQNPVSKYVHKEDKWQTKITYLLTLNEVMNYQVLHKPPSYQMASAEVC